MHTDSWHDFRQKAARARKRIILADGEDPRAIKAAAIVQAERIANPVLIGSSSKIEPLWKQYAGAQPLSFIDPARLKPADQESLLKDFTSIHKHRDLPPAEASRRLVDPLVLGCLYLKRGEVDGFLGGATRTTADTLKAVFSIVGLAPRASTLFGFFLLEGRGPGATGSMILLADCAVMPDPSPKQLANVAIGSASAYEFFLQQKARVAFLSFSTHGSAEHPFVEKIRQALDLARRKAPHLDLEGEWQADAALDLTTARMKGVGNSSMAGRANVLIAPDLNCGNIAYKLVQRLGGCRAVGPVLWGTAQPANDLSRGCSTEDIVDMIALTAIQAQESKAALAVAEPSGKED